MGGVGERDRDGRRGRLSHLPPGLARGRGISGVANPLGIEALRPVLAAGWVAILAVIAMMVASAESLVVRCRRARGPERQQVK
jgi:hypothetical protein